MVWLLNLLCLQSINYAMGSIRPKLTQLAIIQTFCKAGHLFSVCTKSLESDYKVG